MDGQEAALRYLAAQRQRVNRIIGQGRRYDRVKQSLQDAREMTLAIAYYRGRFVCATDLPDVSCKAGWGLLPGLHSTGLAMKALLIPLEKEVLLAEWYDGNEKFVGYRLTETGTT